MVTLLPYTVGTSAWMVDITECLVWCSVMTACVRGRGGGLSLNAGAGYWQSWGWMVCLGN